MRSGSATDPRETSKPPGRDLTAVSASYDTGGALSVTITTAGAPSTPSTFVAAVFYNGHGTGQCTAPLAALGSAHGEASAAWAYEGGEGGGGKRVDGNVTTFTASSPHLAGRGFGCATVELYEIVAGENGPELGARVEYLARPFALNAPPPPPPPPPPPAPVPPPPPPKAALTLTEPAPLTLKRGGWRKVKLQVANGGNATAAKVRVKLGKARGVALKPKSGTVKLRSLKAGQAKVAAFRVRLTRKARTTSSLPVTVLGARGLQARSRLVLKVRRPKAKAPPNEAGGSLAGRVFVRYDSTDSMHSAYLEGYAFIDDTWAYNDIPDGGMPACTKVTGTSKNAGCMRYSYDPRTGAVQVGSLTGGKLTDQGFEIEDESYEELTVPRAGSTFQVHQYFMGFSGLCGMITGCTTWRSDMTMTAAGQFALSDSTTTTSGGSGVPFIAVGDYPPDEHGTYRVERGARIRLAFADGTVDTKTFALFRNARGKADAVNDGFILDDDYFTFAGTD